MTEQEIREFGEALAERYKQVTDEYLVAVKRYKEACLNPNQDSSRLTQLHYIQERTHAAYQTWQAIIDLLPSEIKTVFFEHYQKINPMEEK